MRDVDILIRGGLVFDGAGNAGVNSDLLVRDGFIAQIAPQVAANGAKVIDAGGLAVARALCGRRARARRL